MTTNKNEVNYYFKEYIFNTLLPTIVKSDDFMTPLYNENTPLPTYEGYKPLVVDELNKESLDRLKDRDDVVIMVIDNKLGFGKVMEGQKASYDSQGRPASWMESNYWIIAPYKHDHTRSKGGFFWLSKYEINRMLRIPKQRYNMRMDEALKSKRNELKELLFTDANYISDYEHPSQMTPSFSEIVFGGLSDEGKKYYLFGIHSPESRTLNYSRRGFL